MIQLKRVYEKRGRQDGARFLVERLWPRGLRKDQVQMDGWQKEAGPSGELRKWFSHDATKWTEFQRRYFKELEKRPEAWQPILESAERGAVTLLYSSHDMEHNNAVALKRFSRQSWRKGTRRRVITKPEIPRGGAFYDGNIFVKQRTTGDRGTSPKAGGRIDRHRWAGSSPCMRQD